MTWEVEFTDEFGRWWDSLTESEQDAIDDAVHLLQSDGPMLAYPHSSGIVSSRHPHMRELRAQCRGRPLRVLYAYDPRRFAILLTGGDKTGDNRFYERMVPIADRLYDQHIETLRKEGLI